MKITMKVIILLIMITCRHIEMEGSGQPAKKRRRRRFCSHCNQMLAKTAYWEHQRRYCDTSVDYVNANKEYSDSDSEFELDYAYMENDLVLDDNHSITHDDEMQNACSEADGGKYIN